LRRRPEGKRNPMKKTNILILSAGTRNKVVQYFRKALAGIGKVVATDMSELAPAIYEADSYYIVPRMTAPGYLDVILDICRKEEISGVLSLIDPELSLLAENEDRFLAVGTQVIGSSYELCERSLDKFQMYEWLVEHGYRCAKSYMDAGRFFADVEAGVLSYPVFVKPARGSASIAISKVYDKQTVELLLAHEEGLMLQEFLDGQEIGADVYIDMLSGEIVSIFTKKKIKMRAGETDKAVSFKEDRLFELIERFVKESGYRGQIDIDIFEMDGAYFISEVNPRFGGGYPHAYECGCDHMELIVNNLRGVANERRIGAYEEGICMMKYNEVMIRRENQ
jgi:carbamoyl-phosphate synthase large subunit